MQPSMNMVRYFISKKGGSTVAATLGRLWVEDAGQDLIEYALVAALVGLAAITSLKGLAGKIGGLFNDIGSGMTNAV